MKNKSIFCKIKFRTDFSFVTLNMTIDGLDITLLYITNEMKKQ